MFLQGIWKGGEEKNKPEKGKQEQRKCWSPEKKNNKNKEMEKDFITQDGRNEDQDKFYYFKVEVFVLLLRACCCSKPKPAQL